MRFQYPIDRVRLPNVDDIFTISDAWDYGAKVCLHMSQMVLKFPPDRSLDAEMAASLYSFFRAVMPHTDKEIAKFESSHRRIIKAKMQSSPLRNGDDISNQHDVAKEQGQDRRVKQQPDYDQLPVESKEEHIHTLLPSNTGKVTHSGLALLYGAVVCTVISRSTYNELSIFESSSQKERIVAKAICTNFQLLYVDERMRKDWISWFQIMLDVHRHGIGAAISKHATKIEGEDGGHTVKLTRKQIQKKSAETLKMAQQVNTYQPIFDELFERFGSYIKSDSARAARLASVFDRLQFSIYDQSTTYRYASVVHSDGEKCPVSPYESLRIVGNA
jgi:hypothetical protein